MLRVELRDHLLRDDLQHLIELREVLCREAILETLHDFIEKLIAAVIVVLELLRRVEVELTVVFVGLHLLDVALLDERIDLIGRVRCRNAHHLRKLRHRRLPERLDALETESLDGGQRLITAAPLRKNPLVEVDTEAIIEIGDGLIQHVTPFPLNEISYKQFDYIMHLPILYNYFVTFQLRIPEERQRMPYVETL